MVLELEEVHLVKEGLWGLELGSHLDLEAELAQVKEPLIKVLSRSYKTICVCTGG